MGIIGNGGMLVVDVGGVKPWFMSRNFLAFFTTSSPEDSDLFLFLGVEESADDPGLEDGNFLPLSEFKVFVRFLDFFFVVEVGGVATDPGVGNTSVVCNIEQKNCKSINDILPDLNCNQLYKIYSIDISRILFLKK